ncbi:hypothetical protein TCAL_13793 [Tigriopus californicus]|uniref:F-box domain-containing protein n=1 Tax=Tigriopus californicus TaxID=6832 RepID=A0A553NUR1_TIGCA|nr:hypothetical protein TCAL_13793 [Tigriopus californicus]
MAAARRSPFLMESSFCASNAKTRAIFHSDTGQDHVLWTQLQEIADNACGQSTGESTSSSSSAAESDSLGGGSIRNSSPESIFAKSTTINHTSSSHTSFEDDKFGRLSPMVLSQPSSHKLKQQLMISAGKLRKGASPPNLDHGYHTLTPTSSLDSPAARNSPDSLGVRATKTQISDLHILTHNAKHSPVSRNYKTAVNTNLNSRSSTPRSRVRENHFDRLSDDLVVKILSYLTSNELVMCSRISRRFYFVAWEPQLWSSIWLVGESLDADLALKTIIRLLSRNTSSQQLPVDTLVLGGCQHLTDRGLAIVARRCPQLRHLEVQNCSNLTNGGLMDLVTKCTLLEHLDVSGCHMVSTIAVHQPPQLPNTLVPSRSMQIPHQYHHPLHQQHLLRRSLNLQYLDLTDCTSMEDSGLKMIVETCPQLLYLFLRRCQNITDVGVKYISSYCPSLRELSISDCSHITDFGLYELAKLGPNLRYLSVAKCDQISDSGVKQIAKLCYKLRYLNVRGCEAVSDEAVETLARSCSRLRSLDLGKCDVTDVGLKVLSENCPNLKKLSVKSCEMVSDQGIQLIAYYCRGLQQLNVQDCPISSKGYKTVKKFCRRCIIEHSNPGFF